MIIIVKINTSTNYNTKILLMIMVTNKRNSNIKKRWQKRFIKKYNSCWKKTRRSVHLIMIITIIFIVDYQYYYYYYYYYYLYDESHLSFRSNINWTTEKWKNWFYLIESDMSWKKIEINAIVPLNIKNFIESL